MEITEINLEFVWERHHLILDRENSFIEKWGDDYEKFNRFLEEEPIEKIFEVLIFLYKDQYPKSVYIRFSISGEIGKAYNEGGYECIDSQHLFRDEFNKVKYLFTEDVSHALGMKEFICEFKTSFNLNVVIEKALKDKVFVKEETESLITYSVKDSPIEKLEISEFDFRMILRNT